MFIIPQVEILIWGCAGSAILVDSINETVAGCATICNTNNSRMPNDFLEFCLQTCALRVDGCRQKVNARICAGVPILAWPMMEEQHLNARMVVDEIKMGIRVETCDGSVKGFVNVEGLENTVSELMDGEKVKLMRKKAEELGGAAKKAMDEGGSSSLSLDSLLHEFNIGNSAKI